MTLASASAAALTIGLATPALASPMLGDYQGLRTQGAYSQLLPNEAAQALLQRRGGDCADDGCDGCGDDCGGCGDSCHDSVSLHRHCGTFAGCGHLFGHGVFGGAFGGDDCADECGPHGTVVDWGESGRIGHRRHVRHVMHARPAAPRVVRPGRVVVHRRQVVRVPSRAVRTGFGGSQGTNLPLGIAGLSLILGGAGLLPLMRRRIRTSGRA